MLFVVGIGIGLLCGAFNGALVTRFRLPSIVVTIGTMSLFRGLTQVILGDQALKTYPQPFLDLGQSYFIPMTETGIPWLFIPPVPLSFLVFLVLAVIFGIVLHKTAVGRQLFAIGSNPVAARFSGVPVDRLRFLLFTLSGMLSGLAGALLTARLGSMRSNIAVGWELDIVTMVILGGVSIAGGVGSILGVFLAVLVLGLVTFGMALNNIPGQVISVYIGALLIAVISIPRIFDQAAGRGGQGAEELERLSRTTSLEMTAMDTAKLRHIVLFGFRNGTTGAEIEEIVRRFGSLASTVPGIEAFEWGVNNSPEGKAGGHSHCFTLTFGSEAARDAYLPHPKHQEFVAFASASIERALVFDHWANAAAP